MFAQSLLEYGALSSLRFAFEDMANGVQEWIREVSPTTWVVAALILLLVLRFWSRRKY